MKPPPIHTDPKLPKDIAARMQAIVDRHAQAYRQDLPALIQKMRDLASSVSDSVKWTDKMALLKREAHDMKGQAATFGMPALSTVSQSLCRLLDFGVWEHPQYAEAVQVHVSTLAALEKGDNPMLVEAAREQTRTVLNSRI